MKDSERLARDLGELPGNNCPNPELVEWSIQRVQEAEKRLSQATSNLQCIVNMVRKEWDLQETPAQRVRRETKELFHKEKS